MIKLIAEQCRGSMSRRRKKCRELSQAAAYFRELPALIVMTAEDPQTVHAAEHCLAKRVGRQPLTNEQLGLADV